MTRFVLLMYIALHAGRTHSITLFLRKYPVYCMHITFWITSAFHDVFAYVKLDLSRY